MYFHGCLSVGSKHDLLHSSRVRAAFCMAALLLGCLGFQLFFHFSQINKHEFISWMVSFKGSIESIQVAHTYLGTQEAKAGGLKVWKVAAYRTSSRLSKWYQHNRTLGSMDRSSILAPVSNPGTRQGGFCSDTLSLDLSFQNYVITIRCFRICSSQWQEP